MMTGIQWPFLWTLLVVYTGFVFSSIEFLERHEGESVVLPCVVEPREKPPFGFYLKRSWLHRASVLFKHTNNPFTAYSADENRTSVSGDPSRHSLNVTISQLKGSDTDRYYCEFVVDNPSSEDIHIRGKTEFFLLVHADAPVPADIKLVQTCAGGSAVLPCLPPLGERSAVESVSLKRQRAREPVELLYKHHYSRSSPFVSSQFPVEKVRLSMAPGPGGFTYNVTLQQLQPDDSALYSCQLHMHSRADGTAGLGRRVVFVSVQGEPCGCSSFSALLYALSAVAALALLLLIMLLVIFKGRTRHSDKSHPPAPIYEEMTGVQPLRGKRAPSHLEETETCEYRNCHVKKSCPENYYEKPTGGLSPRPEAQK